MGTVKNVVCMLTFGKMIKKKFDRMKYIEGSLVESSGKNSREH